MEALEQVGAARWNWLRVSFASSAGHSAKYRPDVDGLRAVAVLAVVFYHLGFAPFRGGFVGVDVFYVISGYLITLLLAKDLAEGKFSLASFYERRMRRIFPALFTVLFFCILGTAILFDPPEMIGFGKSLLTTTFFGSNLYFWHSARPLGYFDSGVSTQPLLHTWSLSVEEQFYLLFPLTLFLLYRSARPRMRTWLSVLAAVSFGLNLWQTQHRPFVAFYWSLPRAWELLIGALVALKAVPPLRNRVARECGGALGLGMILGVLGLPLKTMPFPGYIALLPCLGAALVIYAGETGPSSVRTILAFRPLVFVGVISYSLYLWHWPVIVFSKHPPFYFSESSEPVVVLLFSAGAAFFSFEYIERPFRGASSPFSRRQIFAFGFAASVVTAALAATAFRTGGLPQRYDLRTRQLIASNTERMQDNGGSCANWRTEVHALSDIKTCTFGGQQLRKIMFWGDSHVDQLYPAIQSLYSEGIPNDRGVLFMTGSGCLPDETLNNRDSLYHCDTFAKFAMMRAEQEDIDTVFLGFSAWSLIRDNRMCVVNAGRCEKSLLRDELISRFGADLSEEIRTLKQRRKKVIVCLPFPIFDKPIPALEISNAIFGRFGLFETPVERIPPSLRETIKAVAFKNGATIFDPRKTLCPDEKCLFQVEGVSIYRDDNHIAKSQAYLFENSLREMLRQQLSEQTATNPVAASASSPVGTSQRSNPVPRHAL
jgi:peptidoglycan/LPS O-acetylase OafA/YrhL